MLALLLLCPGLPVQAGLEGDTVTVDRRLLDRDTVFFSTDVVVEEGSADAILFPGQNAPSVDVDPDAITLTLGCDFPLCSTGFTNQTFNGFALSDLDWSVPPGPPVDLRVESDFFFDPDRVEWVEGVIFIDILRTMWTSGSTIRIEPVYAPQVEIDIRPGSRTTSIPRRGRIPVALLGAPDVDVTQVDPFSLRFGPGEAEPVWRFWWSLLYGFSRSDVDRDGDEDLVFYFDAREAAIPAGAGEACLTGTLGGLPFEACEEI
jgi:hypothetical protein